MFTDEDLFSVNKIINKLSDEIKKEFEENIYQIAHDICRDKIYGSDTYSLGKELMEKLMLLNQLTEASVYIDKNKEI